MVTIELLKKKIIEFVTVVVMVKNVFLTYFLIESYISIIITCIP